MNPSHTPKWQKSTHQKNRICIAKLEELGRKHAGDKPLYQVKANESPSRGMRMAKAITSSDIKLQSNTSRNKPLNNIIKEKISDVESIDDIFASKPTLSPTSVLVNDVKSEITDIAQLTMKKIFECGDVLNDVDWKTLCNYEFSELSDDFVYTCQELQSGDKNIDNKNEDDNLNPLRMSHGDDDDDDSKNYDEISGPGTVAIDAFYNYDHAVMYTSDAGRLTGASDTIVDETMSTFSDGTYDTITISKSYASQNRHKPRKLEHLIVRIDSILRRRQSYYDNHKKNDDESRATAFGDGTATYYTRDTNTEPLNSTRLFSDDTISAITSNSTCYDNHYVSESRSLKKKGVGRIRNRLFRGSKRGYYDDNSLFDESTLGAPMSRHTSINFGTPIVPQVVFPSDSFHMSERLDRIDSVGSSDNQQQEMLTKGYTSGPRSNQNLASPEKKTIPWDESSASCSYVDGLLTNNQNTFESLLDV